MPVHSVYDTQDKCTRRTSLTGAPHCGHFALCSGCGVKALLLLILLLARLIMLTTLLLLLLLLLPLMR